MKLQLRSLRVLNCGPLRDVCIHFNTEGDCPVTVLAGANGSGKTTALELIAALADTLKSVDDVVTLDAAKQAKGILERTEFAEIELLFDGKPLGVFHGRRPSDAPKPSSYFTLLPNSHSARSLPGHWLRDMRGAVAQQVTTAIKSLTQATILFDDSEPKDDPLLLPEIVYLPYSRFIPVVEAKQIQREEVSYRWVYRYIPVNTFEGSLNSYLIWLDYAEPETFAIVTDFLNSLNFDGKTFSISRRELKVIVTTRDGNAHYLEELSSGEQNILIMLLELRRRLLPGSIVLIDEIENSLHPAFQYRIAEGLKRLQEMVPFQLIVTTHSPTFVEIFDTANTRILTEF